MSIQSWIIASGLVTAMKDAERKNIISNIAKNIDLQLDRHLGSQSEKVQASFVERILIPLGRELIEDDYESKVRYHAVIAKEFSRSDSELRELDRQRQASHMAQQKGRV